MACPFVADRYDYLSARVSFWGYAIDSGGGRDGPSSWNELVRADPVTGLVRIRALRGFGAGRHAEDVYLQFIEYWVPVVQQGPKHDQGNTLIAYAYHCQCGNGSGGSLRYDYDPAGHPDMPSHVHRPGRRRKSVTYVTPEVAIEQFERFVFARLEGGFQPRFSS